MFAKTEGERITNQIRAIEGQMQNIDEEIQKKKLKEENLMQEIDLIDEEIDQTISNLKNLQADTNEKVNNIDSQIE